MEGGEGAGGGGDGGEGGEGGEAGEDDDKTDGLPLPPPLSTPSVLVPSPPLPLPLLAPVAGVLALLLPVVVSSIAIVIVGSVH